MAEEDARISSILVNIILPIAVGIFSLIIIYKHGKNWHHRIFAYFYTNLLNAIMEALEPYKRELFADLENHVSHDVELRNNGVIRILEIGVGPGANFAFYPNNCNLVCYDPNPHFKSALFERCENFPDIHLERFVVCGAENLVDTPDNSVDVVVTTLVLCSVKDVEACLKEVKRVLAPGGKCYFMEHSIAPEGSFHRKIHIILNPFWRTVNDGCNLSRDMEKIILNSGLSHPKFKHFRITKGGLGLTIALNHVVFGTAEKEI